MTSRQKILKIHLGFWFLALLLQTLVAGLGYFLWFENTDTPETFGSGLAIGALFSVIFCCFLEAPVFYLAYLFLFPAVINRGRLFKAGLIFIFFAMPGLFYWLSPSSGLTTVIFWPVLVSCWVIFKWVRKIKQQAAG